MTTENNNLHNYRKTEIIYDATVYFTNRFFGACDRATDKMVQAAGNVKQKLAEAREASATSKYDERFLTNAARTSLEELLIDYHDFLCIRELPVWNATHRLTVRFRELNRTPNATYQTYVRAIENESPEICANSMMCLIKITIYLLTQQIRLLEKRAPQHTNAPAESGNRIKYG